MPRLSPCRPAVLVSNRRILLGAPLLLASAAVVSAGPTPRPLAVAAAYAHSCALTDAGGVKCWGRNFISGEVGDGSDNDRSRPVDVAGLTSGVLAVATGDSHTCVVTSAGGVKCWGMNDFGQLGNEGRGLWQRTPYPVWHLASGVAAIDAGAGHTCALMAAGGVKCWGANTSGQVGDGTIDRRLTPVDVVTLPSGIAAVSAGRYHTCALTTDGGVKCWGATYGATPVDVSSLGTGVVALAAGADFTCAVMPGGGVKCWGVNNVGQLGDGTTSDRTTPVDVLGVAGATGVIAAGWSHACVVCNGGVLRCWGANDLGQLGDGTTVTRLTAVPVMRPTAGVVAVSAGAGHTCAVTVGAGIKCSGSNYRGQLGDGTWADHWAPGRVFGFGRTDADADDRADVAVFRPSSATWFSLDSATSNNTYRYRGWGSPAQGDTPVVGDFDGDGVLDFVVYRPADGTWFILESGRSYNTWRAFGWGVSDDVLVPGDYDGDGKTDAAVYRPSTGRWYVRPSSGATAWSLAFGEAGDQPVAGDFDGDGKRDLAVYRPSTGAWAWLTSSSNYTASVSGSWGLPAESDVPAPGDYDGDGTTDICVFRPGTGTWFILESHAGFTTWSSLGWGTTGDTVVPADYDGDGKTDAAIYRASSGEWFVRPSSGATRWSVHFGDSADLPLVSIR